MTIARAHLISEESPGHYHLISRCVRRARLCGVDPLSGKDYSYRRQAILDCIQSLVPCYAIEINAYAIMSNHFHIALYVDPQEPHRWSDQEVARRWVDAYPPRVVAQNLFLAKEAAVKQLELDPCTLKQRRKDLGSLSHLMKNLKGPLARKFNLEDGCTGAYWEGRFKSVALEDEQRVLKCLRYIDLNPHKAGMADTLDECELTTVEARIRAAELEPVQLDAPMCAYLSGLGYHTRFSITTRQYLNVIEQALREPLTSPPDYT